MDSQVCTSGQCKQTWTTAKWNAHHRVSPSGKVITAVQLWASFFLLYSTVLQNFSRSQDTVLEREERVVVVLSNPAPHYRGTALTLLHCLQESHSLACLSNLYCSSLCCLLSLCYTAVSFVFIPSHLLCAALLFRPWHCFPLTSPYLSDRELFMSSHRSTCLAPDLHIYSSQPPTSYPWAHFSRPYDLWPRCHL